MAGIPAVLRKAHRSDAWSEAMEARAAVLKGTFPGAAELVAAIRAWEAVRLGPRTYEKDRAHDDLASLLGLTAIRAVGHYDHNGYRYRAADDGSFTRTPLERRRR